MSQDLFNLCNGTDIIIRGPITGSTPIIVNPVPVCMGGVCQACTVDRETIDIDPTTTLEWYRPPGAMNAPPQSAGAVATTPPASFYATSSSNLGADPLYGTTSLGPMPPASIAPPHNPDPLNVDYLMESGHFETQNPSYLLNIPSDRKLTSGAATGLYTGDGQNDPFSPLATLAPTSTYIPPENTDMFNPSHFNANISSDLSTTGQKRTLPPHAEQNKCRKLDERMVVHRGVVNTSNSTEVVVIDRDPSIGLHVTHQRPTNTTTRPIHVPSLERPEGMPMGEFKKLLHAKIAELERLD